MRVCGHRNIAISKLRSSDVIQNRRQEYGERRNTKPKNFVNENLMLIAQIGKGPKKNPWNRDILTFSLHLRFIHC